MHPPFSLFFKHLCMSMWSMSHFRTSMQRKIEVLLTTMCKYDCRMFGNTWSSSILTPGSLCGIYSGYSSWLILLNISPHYGSIILDLMLYLVSPKHGGSENSFFVKVLMTGSALGANSNYLAVLGEEPSHISDSFCFGALGARLVVGFLNDILPENRAEFRYCVRNWMNIYKL
jgi:hypothetical protein